MSDRVKQFSRERERLNELVLGSENLNIKRFYGIDSAVYRDGALDSRTKELLGLVASLVLRCDDCVAYHTVQVKELGITDDQFSEAMSVGMVVGGSITIPHVRRAYQLWEDLRQS